MVKTHDADGKEVWVLEEGEYYYGDWGEMVGKVG